MFDFEDQEPAETLSRGADGASEDEGEDEDDSVILVDAWRVPRGRCLSCSNCSLWQKATGPFAHLTCSGCKCKTADHEDLSAWMREVLEHSTPSVESLLVSTGIPLKAYTRWSPLETLFHLETHGAFHPVRDGRAACQAEPPGDNAPERPLCSVICPTMAERHGFHPLLYHCFSRQTYEPRELVVIDTGPRPSSFLQERARRDPSLVYRWFKEGRWSIGLKRNLACFLARGDLIAHFDDDDLYAPDYLAQMSQVILDAAGNRSEREEDAGYVTRGEEVDGARANKEPALAAVAATLVTWHVFDTNERCFRFLHAVSDKWVYGWGFSFIYTREAWRRNFFPHRDIGEDFDFMMALRKLKGCQVLTVEDIGALCSHTHHPKLSISGGEKRRDGTRSPLGQEVQPPEPLVTLLPLLFEADARALRDSGKRPPPNEEDYSYFVLGSWNNWSSFDELRRTGNSRAFTATIPVGAPMMVEFQVFANRDWTMSYYPSAKGPILGPWRCPGSNWKLTVPKGRNAISVSWDPTGDRSLLCAAVNRSGQARSAVAAAPKATPKPAAQPPSLSIAEALEMQQALIAEYVKEDFRRQLRQIKVRAGDDQVLKYKLRQDLCLPIQGPIISRFGFEPSRKGVAQTVTLFHTAEWCHNQTVQNNNNLMAALTDPEQRG